MSYLALARKWRPQTFEQVVGQGHVLTALGNALNQNRLHHAYLLSGTRGVGKTTIGRLFAKGLNCETGITGTPCGVCASCQEIDQGRFVDLLEIDAASRTKVEDTRDLLDNVQYKPARGRFKVYLIDEVHMLSRHSFNALLKTLEEPPEYVKFLLATTDPQKLPVTILSRCLQFHLKPIAASNIQEQLEYILAQEGVNAESRALGLLAHAADGSMRDALSLTDQAIALGNGHIEAHLVRDMLGSIDTDQALDLLDALATQQVPHVMTQLAQFAQNGIEWDSLLQELAAQLHRVALCQVLPASLDKAQPDAERIERLSGLLTPQDVQLYYHMALKGRDEMPLAPSGQIAMEMIALRMLAFRPAPTIAAQPIVAPVAMAQTEVTSQTAAQSIQPQTRPTVSAPTQSAAEPNVPTYSQPVNASISARDPQQAHSMTPQVTASSPLVNEPAVQTVSSPAPSSAAPARSEVESPEPATTSGLRHQLRSQRQQKGGSDASNGTKKSEHGTGKESVLTRIRQQHAPVSPTAAPKQNVVANDEPYQWRPSQEVAVMPSAPVLKPSEVKQALEHEKTPEMVARLADEACEQNDWARLIRTLSISKLVEQLALNSALTQHDNTLLLTLRANQAHLNTDRAQSELLAALNHQLGQPHVLSIEIGESGETPLELRERLYQQHWQQALNSLESDATVQFIQRRFAAELERETVRPI
ncbi:DNA polymerase III subunit gamma/tau [Vibrio sp. SM6]|uniref:DNA polymerase III subunit gamma/tau n=1 Tax=Vibrio agarilyticus TaxID=2726741 RepID=A0A7X8TTJ9_9VIBR|nr:DNA polymerase III subunit gamma/tau [Vibrio agarilyticus]NLS14535.1 DNA polymerase III subunit gamma/tau [Vibrio agarilyticus]